MKPRSRIQKGRRFEKYICQEIENMGLGKARRESGSGSGKYKGDIFADLPFLIEAKNQKTIKLLEWVEQAKKQAEIGNWDGNKWALIIRNPKSPEDSPDCLAVIDMWEWLKLLKKDKEPMIKQPDKDLAYDLASLRIMCNKVIRKLE